ncbi:MAG TPA: 50S ribosomal protein L4 [Candidatus Saccharimonadales bacterium]|nr:50S ribosomal protein L4 [Candidatus Saccharimonadales bacterium]
MAVATYTKSGAKAATPAKLDKAVFGVEVKNHELLKQAYQTYLANGRPNLAKTKRRGEVRGGGAKPWRQKGTGRARFGSSRNPIWTGGGVAFGPTGKENYSKKLNVSAKRAAIRQALSLAASEDRIKVIDSFTTLEGKTKDMAAFLKKIDAAGRILLVSDQRNPSKELAVRNLQDVKPVSAVYLNVYDILNADVVVISAKALESISGWLGSAKPKAKKETANV